MPPQICAVARLLPFASSACVCAERDASTGEEQRPPCSSCQKMQMFFYQRFGGDSRIVPHTYTRALRDELVEPRHKVLTSDGGVYIVHEVEVRVNVRSAAYKVIFGLCWILHIRSKKDIRMAFRVRAKLNGAAVEITWRVGGRCECRGRERSGAADTHRLAPMPVTRSIPRSLTASEYGPR